MGLRPVLRRLTKHRIGLNTELTSALAVFGSGTENSVMPFTHASGQECILMNQLDLRWICLDAGNPAYAPIDI